MKVDAVNEGSFGIRGTLTGSLDDLFAFAVSQSTAGDSRNIKIGIPGSRGLS